MREASRRVETALSTRKTLPCGTVFSLHQLMNQMIDLDTQMDSA